MERSFFKVDSDKYVQDNVQSLKDISVKNIDGEDKKIGEYLHDKKAVLFVNVASACGYTDSNYKYLAELYDKFKGQGVEVLGFPCNQFANQESKCEVDIKNYLKSKYTVDFPMFSKIDVNGDNTHPLYTSLKVASKDLNLGNDSVKNIPWNFSKFLVDKDGNVVKFYNPDVTVDTISADIQALL